MAPWVALCPGPLVHLHRAALLPPGLCHRDLVQGHRQAPDLVVRTHTTLISASALT